MNIGKRIAKLLGERNLGRLDYVLKPGLRSTWGGPFNGQAFRQRMFLSLMGTVGCRVIVETGTYHGTTTAFLAASGLPVYSVESNPRFYAYASWRLYRSRSRIRLREGDSRPFLRSLALDRAFPGGRAFFYLDAHWHSDLPLRDELKIIFEHWSDSVVMVDDFQVPGTTYGYDDYGPGRALNLEYLEPLRHLQLATFFPAMGPEAETGARRGCIVLCRAGGEVERLLGAVGELMLAPGHPRMDE